jgi:hypothetical protein
MKGLEPSRRKRGAERQGLAEVERVHCKIEIKVKSKGTALIVELFSRVPRIKRVV